MVKILLAIVLLASSAFATGQTADLSDYIITSKTWQTHLWEYIFAHPELSPAQRAWLDKSISKLEGKDLYADKQQLRRDFVFARNEATILFGAVTARELLTTLDTPTVNYFAVEKPVCPCATESDWCNGMDYRCLSGGSNCTWQEMGCGTFLLESCNGMCLYCPGCN